MSTPETNVNEEKKPERKKVLLSGIQPTGVFTLGNYIGAVRNWKQLQEDYDCAYFIADLHSAEFVGVRQDRGLVFQVRSGSVVFSGHLKLIQSNPVAAASVWFGDDGIVREVLMVELAVFKSEEAV